MRRHRGRTTIVAALGVALIGAYPAAGSDAAQPPQPLVSASVGGTPSGAAMAPGYVGLSLEYQGVQQYGGRDPHAVNPVFVQLVRNLAPGQHPVLRIGGDSADSTWLPVHGVKAPRGATYALTPAWFSTAHALAGSSGARMVLGVNLAGGRRAVAAAEGRAILQSVGRSYVQALEIGNEPDVYNVFPWYFDRRGREVFARGPRYDLKAFIREFSNWSAALPKVALAGPAFAELTWLPALDQFIHAEPGLRLVTIHRYPLRASVTDPSSASYPSIASLLGDRSSGGLAQNVAPYVAVAHSHGLPLRIDEMNSASHFGKRGVSDTFGAALWVLDTLFNLANVGTDGVNVHTRPDAAYGLFTFTRAHKRWQAFVRPEYYGMLMFEQAFPPGAHLLSASAPSGPVKVWATRGSGRTRVALINKDPGSGYAVQLQVAAAGTGSRATLERLQAPKVTSTSGVTLGEQSFGRRTTTGRLPGPPHTEPVTSVGGYYTIDLPAASAALLTQ